MPRVLGTDIPLTFLEMIDVEEHYEADQRRANHQKALKQALLTTEHKEKAKRSAKKLKTFKFHGAFKSKADAVAKEKEIDGAFIRHKNGRYYVIQRLT